MQHDIETWDRWIVPSGERNGLLRVGIARQPDIAGTRIRASQWGAINDEFNKSRTIWNCVSKQIPTSLYEVPPD
jgi:hypothetical protein